MLRFEKSAAFFLASKNQHTICMNQKNVVTLQRKIKGVLAHLARARHWQCRGERFESAILHI